MASWNTTVLCLVLAIRLLCLSRNCQASVSLDDFFPFGFENGDTLLPANDDGSTPDVNLSPFTLPFAGWQQKKLWVNNNGDVSFHYPFGSNDAECRSYGLGSRIIAVFWTDISTRRGGQLFYRQSTEPKLLQKAERDVLGKYHNFPGLELKWLFVSTWKDVKPFRESVNSSNTFQLALTTDGKMSFALMYYNKIKWSNGYSGDAKVGFDIGKGGDFVKLEGSCTSDIINITDWSNTGVPGKFVFRIDSTSIETGSCEPTAYEHGRERLKATPHYVSTLGHVPIAFQGACFPANATATCTFDDLLRQPVTIEGIVESPSHGTPTVYCTAPYLYGLGRTNVHLTVTEKASDGKMVDHQYFSFISVVATAPQVSVNITSAWSTKNFTDDVTVLDFFWSSQSPGLQGAALIDIIMIWYDPTIKQLTDLLLISGGISNTGYCRVDYNSSVPNTIHNGSTLISLLLQSFVIFSVRPSKAQSEDLYNKGTAIFSEYFAAKEIIRMAKIEVEYDKPRLPKELLYSLPSCPCTLSQAENDLRFVKSMPFTMHQYETVWYFNIEPVPTSSAGQQCAYGSNRKLVIDSPQGGFVSKVDRTISVLDHWYFDVVPWLNNCRFTRNVEKSCRKYYAKRLADTCGRYQPPVLALGNENGHMITFDQYRYTFNGVGEFVLLVDESRNFTMQARMEQLGNTKTSVFSAFVMKQSKTVVQVQQSSSNLLAVLVDGYLLEFNDKTLKSQTFNKQASVIALDGELSAVAVSFASGFSFMFMVENGKLAMIAAASHSNKASKSLRGLLGNYDGDIFNDLVTPNGTVLQPNVSMSDIHWKFGIEWMVSENDTLFKYRPETAYTTFARPQFVPTFKISKDDKLSLATKEMCRDSNECSSNITVFDDDLEFANGTPKIQQEFYSKIKAYREIIPKCVDISMTFEKGVMRFTDGLFVGSFVSVMCDPGYILAGKSAMYCNGTATGDAAWNGIQPHCLQPACPDFDFLENGNIAKSNATLPGSVATFSCLNEYKLVGPSSATCVPSIINLMEWSHPLPTCVPVACTLIGSLSNGQILLSNSTYIGSVATFTCDRDYELVGSSSATCLQIDDYTLSWSSKVPKCEMKFLCQPIGLENGHFVIKSKVEISFSCDHGYELVGSPSANCTADRSWSNPPPVCTPMLCPAVTLLENGQFSATNGTKFGSEVFFSCNAGYDLVGSQFSKCVWSGNESVSWSSQTPTCLLVQCPIITAPENGKVSYTDKLFPGTQAVFQCNDGFELVGSRLVTCLGNSISSIGWNSSVPNCAKLQCPPLEGIENGQIFTSKVDLTPGTIAKFACSEGFELLGSSTASCRGVSLNSTAWSNPIPQCVLIACPPIGSIKNGHVVTANQSVPGSEAHFSCDRGYKLVGSKTAKCNGSSLQSVAWNSSAPYCMRLACPPIKFVLNGKFSMLNGASSPGSKVAFTCDEGHHLIGSSLATCTANEHGEMAWSSPIPSCLRKPEPNVTSKSLPLAVHSFILLCLPFVLPSYLALFIV